MSKTNYTDIFEISVTFRSPGVGNASQRGGTVNWALKHSAFGFDITERNNYGAERKKKTISLI